MTLPLQVREQFDAGRHQYRVYEPAPNDEWLRAVAKEYVRLRTSCVVPLTAIQFDGIEVLDVRATRKRMRSATIPPRVGGNFDVLRSDFSEIAGYLLLADQYGTRFGYQGIRDRETIRLPGRGIDAVGVESGEKLILVLGEVKASEESSSPPRVVDRNDDCLRNQHRSHLNQRKSTIDKVWDLARRCREEDLRNHFLAAATLLEQDRLDRLDLICFCLVVRPKAKYKKNDFGTFASTPGDYVPGIIRFLIVWTSDTIEATVDEWYKLITDPEEVGEVASDEPG